MKFNALLVSDFWRYTWHGYVSEYATFEKLHNVEWRADNITVIAQHDQQDRHMRLGASHGARVVFVDCGEHSVFPLDLVCGLRDQLACRFFSEHKT